MNSLKFLIFTSIFIASVVCGKIEIAPFISNGEYADIKELPFLISIQQSTVRICTGSLISSKFALTAARTIVGRNISQLVIEYGSSVINPGASDRLNTVGINQIIYHPEYNNTSHENDICIVELEAEINLDGFYEPFANLATSGTRFSSGTIATHAGWGNIDPDTRTNQLHRANLRIISQSECIEAVGDTKQPFFRNICAMKTSVICNGDIGSPLLINRILVGIASFRNGESCVSVEDRFPNVYTAVSFYVGWIERITGIRYRVNTFLSTN